MSTAEPKPHQRTSIMVTAWIVAHLIMVPVWLFISPGMDNDCTYYWRALHDMGSVGLGQTMPEYPTPVVGILGIFYLIGFGMRYVMEFWFVLGMAAADLVFTFMVWRHGGPRHIFATYFWIAFVAGLGPLLLFRFDVLPAALAGIALLWMYRHPRVAGACIGIGAAIKLWPALLIIPLLAPRKERLARVQGFVGMGFGLALVSLIVGGWDRLVSPLTYQSGRGLQIESLAATPLMVLRHLDPSRWSVKLSVWKAFEIFGPGVAAALKVSSLMTALGLGLIGLLCWRLFRMRVVHRDAITLVTIAIVTIMIVTNKTLSPQYTLWLAGPIAILVAMAEANPSVLGTKRSLQRFAGSALILAVLTQLVYPITYDNLVEVSDGTVISTTALVVRNIYLLGWSGWVIWLAWKSTKSRSSAPLPLGRRNSVGSPHG